MNKRTIISCILLAICTLANAQINKYGNPIITNYTSDDYNDDAQNFFVAKDHRDIMYFAGNENILEYDGTTWRSIPIYNQKDIKANHVRSFAVDDNGVIYVGAENNIGYLSANNNGSLTYHSLSGIDSTISIEGQILRTYCNDTCVYFCSDINIYVYNKTKNTLENWPLDDTFPWYSFLVNDRLLVSSYKAGLREISTKGFTPVTEGIHEVSAFIPNKEDEYILFELYDGIILKYNLKANKFEDVSSNRFKSFLRASDGAIVYAATKTKEGNYLASIVQSENPIIVLDQNYNITNIFNRQTGTKDIYSTHIESLDNNIYWASMNVGLSKIENSAIHVFNEIAGKIRGGINDILISNGILYVATFEGVFFLTKDNDGIPVFQAVDGINGVAYSISEIIDPTTHKKRILVGSQTDIKEISNFSAESLVNNAKARYSAIWSMKQNPQNPNQIFCCTEIGFSIISIGKTSYTIDFVSDDIAYPIRNLCFDSQNNAWVAGDFFGIANFKNNGESEIFSDENEVFSNVSKIYCTSIDNKILACTTQGLFEYNSDSNTFVVSDIIGESGKHSINKIAKYKNGYIITRTDDHKNRFVELILPDSSGNQKVISAPFRRLPNKDCDAILVDEKNDIIWLALDQELYSFHCDILDELVNEKVEDPYKRPFKVNLRQITMRDSILFNGAFASTDGGVALDQASSSNNNVIISYKNNSLEFTYSAAWYEKNEETEYSSILEGSEKEWSKWNKRTSILHNNLSEGKYTFKVKARNIYGIESNVAEYSFVIKPPFYRTIVAYILYVLFGVALIIIIVRLNSARLLKEKARLEQVVADRTAEVVQQKDEIEKQKEEIEQSINYAKGLQQALLSKPEDIEEAFPDAFLFFEPKDVVSGDFHWIKKIGHYRVSVIADSTGHGVPGGFVSMLGMTNLNHIVGSEMHPDKILFTLREYIIQCMGGWENGRKDGMDLALYIVDERNNHMEFAGANNPLVIIRNNEVYQIKADKMPIGNYIKGNAPFTNISIDLYPGDCLYTFSDGYQDQIGGPDKRKFMSKHLREMLLEIHNMPMAEQREMVKKRIYEWQAVSKCERVDDVILMGYRVGMPTDETVSTTVPDPDPLIALVEGFEKEKKEKGGMSKLKLERPLRKKLVDESTTAEGEAKSETPATETPKVEASNDSPKTEQSENSVPAENVASATDSPKTDDTSATKE